MGKTKIHNRKTPDRVFIPAKLSDNQFIDQESYIKSLDQLDPVKRKQLLEGDWEVTPGGKIFQRCWFTGDTKHPCRLIEPKDVPSDTPRYRVWDCAATAEEKGKDPDWTVGTLSTYKNGNLYIIDVVRFRKSPSGTKETMQETADNDGLASFNAWKKNPEQWQTCNRRLRKHSFSRTQFQTHQTHRRQSHTYRPIR
jgi:hypothetical protein